MNNLQIDIGYLDQFLRFAFKKLTSSFVELLLILLCYTNRVTVISIEIFAVISLLSHSFKKKCSRNDLLFS